MTIPDQPVACHIHMQQLLLAGYDSNKQSNKNQLKFIF